MTSTHLFTEEPPDGTILADGTITEVLVRDDAAANDKLGSPDRRWYMALGPTDVGSYSWATLADQQWQRLYRQSDVDALLAAQREQIAQAIEALDPVEAALAGQYAWSEAAKVARTLTPEEG